MPKRKKRITLKIEEYAKKIKGRLFLQLEAYATREKRLSLRLQVYATKSKERLIKAFEEYAKRAKGD